MNLTWTGRNMGFSGGLKVENEGLNALVRKHLNSLRIVVD